MRELTDWAASSPLPDKPWLILGKGPTFARREDFDLSEYNLIALNHAVVEQPVQLAHLVDLDVVEDCGDVLLENSDFVVMPRHPHLENRPTVGTLERFIPHMPTLRALDEADRLIWYNAGTGPVEDGAPVIDLTFFSSEAALGIVAALGARVVRSLGVDGGRGYSGAFRAVQDRTLLRNGRASFNSQFAELDRIARRHEVDYRPLVAPARVFIGGDPDQRVAAEVLQHSLLLNASGPVRVDLLEQSLPRVPKEPRQRPRTPFSFNRFLIPSLMGYEGTALYLDSDMLVFDDVTKLFGQPFDGNSVLCTSQPQPPEQWKGVPEFRPGRQFSVMLIDCERARWDIEEVIEGLDAGRFTYEELMFELALVPDSEIEASIPSTWNHLERYEPGQTQLLHFTVVPQQPWRNSLNPLRPVWLEAFRLAVRDGAVDLDALERSVGSGVVDHDLLAVAQDELDSMGHQLLNPTQIEIQLLRSRVQELEALAAGATPGRRAARGLSDFLSRVLRRTTDQVPRSHVRRTANQ